MEPPLLEARSLGAGEVHSGLAILDVMTHVSMPLKTARRPLSLGDLPRISGGVRPIVILSCPVLRFFEPNSGRPFCC